MCVGVDKAYFPPGNKNIILDIFWSPFLPRNFFVEALGKISKKRKELLNFLKESKKYEERMGLLVALYYVLVGAPEEVLERLKYKKIKEGLQLLLNRLENTSIDSELREKINKLLSLTNSIEELESKANTLMKEEENFIKKISEYPFLRLELTNMVDETKKEREKILDNLEKNKSKFASLLKETRSIILRLLEETEEKLLKIKKKASGLSPLLYALHTEVKVALSSKLKSFFVDNLDYSISNIRGLEPVVFILKEFFKGGIKGIITVKGRYFKEDFIFPKRIECPKMGIFWVVEEPSEGLKGEKMIKIAYSLALLFLLPPPPTFNRKEKVIAWLLYYSLYCLFLRGVYVEEIKKVAEELLELRKNKKEIGYFDFVDLKKRVVKGAVDYAKEHPDLVLDALGDYITYLFLFNP